MIKVNLDELSAGMILAENVFDPKTQKLLLKSDTKLTDVIIKSLYSHHISEVLVVERYTLSIDPIDTTRNELKVALLEELVKTVPPKAEANPSDVISHVADNCAKIIDDIISNDDIISFCVQMKLVNSSYLFKHSISTCVLSILVAGSMNSDMDFVTTVGQAALIHDLGLSEMPTIINLKERNTQEEALWQEHTKYGYYFAIEKGIPENISRMILYHHEKWNGTGFPDKLSGNDIPLGSQIIAVCSSYDELLKLYKTPHYQAIEYLYATGNLYFDINVINALINNIAVYPLGSLVRLSNDETGIVVNVRKNLGPRPVIKVYFNRFNRPLKSPTEIDLGVERTVFIKEVL